MTNTSTKPHSLSFSIANMHCASCTKQIERAILSLPDVESVEVNFANKEATVSGKINAKAIIRVLAKIGYTATIKKENDQLSEKENSKNYYYLLLKSFVAFIVGVPLFLDLFFSWLPPLKQTIEWPWVLISLMTLGVMSFSGGHLYRSAFKSFLHHQANMDTLVALGTGAAWLYSTIVILFPMWVPTVAWSVYFDTAVMLIAFITFGGALEVKARGKTSQAIKKLMTLRPKTAVVIKDNGREVNVNIDEIQQGDLIRVRPGEVIAVDGVIKKGESQADESMLTGESMPVHKYPGDEVTSGTINKMGSFIFAATRVGKDTALSRIILMVQNAQNTKPKIGKLADKVSAVFVPIVIIIALITALIWFNVGPSPKAGYVLVTTIAVLVIACPCALGLATPISIVAGVGVAAETGILIRSGDALEVSSHLDVIVLDKTGTVTEGKPTVTEVVLFDKDYDKKTFLQYVASVELKSEHSLASAIVEYVKNKKLDLLDTDDFIAIAGRGVSAQVNKDKVEIGNKKYFSSLNISTARLEEAYERLTIEANTPIAVAINGKLIGVIGVTDPVKPDSVKSIKQLKKLGLRVVMITGDNKKTAQAIAHQVGIEEYFAEVLPEQKAEKIKLLQQQGLKVGMVGDGINDAPALTQAEVGFAMGTGTDVAIESAEVTLISGSLTKIVSTIAVSKATIRNIKQNLWGAFLYNGMGIPIAAGVLYPFIGVLLSPIIAGAAMALSSITVVVNANRLRFLKLKVK